MIKKLVSWGVICTVTVLQSVSLFAEEQQKARLHVYNWNDYIAQSTIPVFEERTGIKIVYDVYDSNEVLEAKVLAGSSGFDIVVPSDNPFFANQIKASAYQPLDKSNLPNLDKLDPALLAKVSASADPGNKYGIPYLWGTTGIGYNLKKVQEVLGADVPLDSWDLVFNSKNMEKLARCGVSFLDAPLEIIPTALKYLGLDPNSTNKADYLKATELLLAVRPYVTYFHSSKYIADLANGDICVAIGFSGDILQARDRAEEANNGIAIQYVIPKEGAQLWFDMLAIPADAKHVDEAYAFLNHLLEPETIAQITNYVSYANPNLVANEYVDEEIKNDPGIYPPPAIRKNLYKTVVLPKKINRIITRSWTRVKSGR